MLKKIFKYSLASITIAIAAAVVIQPIYVSAETVVTSANTDWWFFQETPTGSGLFINGPFTPPLGTGSAQLTVNSTGGEIFGTFAFVGTRLDAITSLGYDTYRVSGSAAFAPTLQLDIDTDVTDGNTAWQGRLVYEPYFTHVVSSGVWQSWNPQDNVGTGNWWFSGAPGNVICKLSNPCTWAEVRAAFPNAGIRSAGTSTGALQFKVGGGWAGGYVGSVDAFSIGINNVISTYDFELPAVIPLLPTAGGGASNANRTSITVVVQANNDNGGTSTYSNFPIFVNGDSFASGETRSFSPGVYIVTQDNRSGYTVNFTGDCDANGQINLMTLGGNNNNPNAVCTVVNNDIGSPTTAPIPPLIDIIKIPSQLTLPDGPGLITYTYTVSNVGVVPITDVSLLGDVCSFINFVSGDINGDSKLDVNEKWFYKCTTQLTETTRNTVVAIGHANGLTATKITNATVVVGVADLPPLIHVVKVPDRLVLPAGGGQVIFNITVTNPGLVALSNVGVSEDILGSEINFVSGDTNGDSKLDPNETWLYTYRSILDKTLTNTVVASGLANGFVATDVALATVVVSVVPGLPDTGAPFLRNLRLGMSGADVRALQEYLNTHGYALAGSGVGSRGNETNYFGRLTQQALIKFQKGQGILPSVGYFGVITRGAMNK